MKYPVKRCAVQNCENKSHARGFCNKHYVRFMRHGNTQTVMKGGKPYNPVGKDSRELANRHTYQDFCSISDIFPGIAEIMFKAD